MAMLDEALNGDDTAHRNGIDGIATQDRLIANLSSQVAALHKNRAALRLQLQAQEAQQKQQAQLKKRQQEKHAKQKQRGGAVSRAYEAAIKSARETAMNIARAQSKQLQEVTNAGGGKEMSDSDSDSGIDEDL
jgi:predicted  nucleic acid-binding Zn-ribbon protein